MYPKSPLSSPYPPLNLNFVPIPVRRSSWLVRNTAEVETALDEQETVPRDGLLQHSVLRILRDRLEHPKLSNRKVAAQQQNSKKDLDLVQGDVAGHAELGHGILFGFFSHHSQDVVIEEQVKQLMG